MKREKEESVVEVLHKTIASGTQVWFYVKFGKVYYHREWDKPAMVGIDGSVRYFIHGKLHRDGDKPAMVLADGSQYFFKDGSPHREDGPAEILADGTMRYFRHGKLHRAVGPAVIAADGSVEYHRDGLRHNAQGPAAIMKTGKVVTEYRFWNALHNFDGPAVEFRSGAKDWYIFGLRHNYVGPAIITEHGDRRYFLHGVEMSETEWKELIKDRSFAEISAIMYGKHPTKEVSRHVARVLKSLGEARALKSIKKFSSF